MELSSLGLSYPCMFHTIHCLCDLAPKVASELGCIVLLPCLHHIWNRMVYLYGFLIFRLGALKISSVAHLCMAASLCPCMVFHPFVSVNQLCSLSPQVASELGCIILLSLSPSYMGTVWYIGVACNSSISSPVVHGCHGYSPRRRVLPSQTGTPVRILPSLTGTPVIFDGYSPR